MSQGSAQPGKPGSLRRELLTLPTAAHAAHLLRVLCARSAAFLQRPTDDVTPSSSWADLGFDSLRAVDFRSELETALDLRLRSTLLFDQPTPTALTEHLLAELQLDDAEPKASPQPTASGAAPLDNDGAIAIVGAACRFPGSDGLDAFWDLLQRGGDAVGPIGNDRFDMDSLYDPDPNADGKLYVREAGLIDDLAGFDAAMFGISPREATLLDPQQRLLLETSWHAFEHAGLPPASLREQCVGVYVGTRASEYFDSQSNRTPSDANGYYATGNAISTAAGRISFTFGFRGPCYALDTACSGSLVAVHNAVRALRAGECEVALAGGVNAIMDPVPMAGLCRARMLAPDGRCKSFDERADGYGRGEGCGMIVLKRLAQAEADGDRILAVVRGTASNQDGRSSGLTVPHGPSQSAVIRDALADASVQPCEIDYLEAHGTGTALGDPIEIAALDEVFAGRKRPLPVGTVKTNIGHLEAAAGISGLIKTVLVLQHRELPKTLHCDNLSSHIDWQQSVVEIVRERAALPADKATHLAGVSSFGFSGTNCHVVLSSPPKAVPATAAQQLAPASDCMLALQAASNTSLRALARAHADRLSQQPVDLAAYSRKVAQHRSDQPHRAAFVASDQQTLAKALAAFGDGEDAAASAHAHAAAVPPRVAFLFPGQGSQVQGMGEELAAHEPVFRDALGAAAERLAEAGLETPLHTLLWQGDGSQLQRTDATQPALCAYQLAMVALLRSIGMQPDAVLGHSVGDYAAAVAAGVLDGSDALALCAARGRLMVDTCERGGMLSVLAPVDTWQHLLPRHPDISIAVHNAPANIAVGGKLAALDALQQELEALGISVRRLSVSHAFHTATTEPMLEPFAATFAGLRLRAPQCTFVDCATGQPAGKELTTSEHWVRHVREPVHFTRGVRGLEETECTFWLELGATSMLTALVAANSVQGAQVVPLQRHKRPARTTLLAALARMWVHGVAMNVAAINHHGHTTPNADGLELPNYPFDRQRFWLTKKATPRTTAGGEHPLLGTRQRSSLLQAGQTLFAQQLAADSPAWLADHVAFDRVLFPAAGMIECALQSEHLRSAQLPVRVYDASLRAPLMLDDDAVAVESLATTERDHNTFRLSSLPEGSDRWVLHLDAKTSSDAGARPESATLKSLAQRFRTDLAPSELYARCRNAQLDYGERFRCVRSVAIDGEEALAEVVLPDELSASGFVLHPALLDACFHTLFAILPSGAGTMLPIGLEQLTVHQAGCRRVWCHTRIRSTSGKSRSADLTLYNELGQLCAEVQGLQLVPTDAATVRAATGRQRDLLYHIAWENSPASQEITVAKGVAIVGAPALAEAVAANLPKGAAHVCQLADLGPTMMRQRIDRVLVLCCNEVSPGTDARDAMAMQRAILADALQAAQIAAQAPGPPQLCFVTHGMQDAAPAPAGPLPHAASVLGLRRTLAIEMSRLQPTSIDLDPTVPTTDAATHARALARELQRALDEPEVALRADVRRVPRLRRGSTPKNALLAPASPCQLRAKAYGQFDHLHLQPLQRTAPGAGKVEVAMHAAALNFKDALHVLGMLRDHSEKLGIHTAPEQPLGFEGSGVVVSVGDGATELRVGDRVVVSAASCLQSHVTAPAASCMQLPDHVDLCAAAGLPTVFGTVLHSLCGLANVQPGEVVLVHAAAGGVGQAAIQLLTHLGCRVLATASPNKHGLVTRLGAEVIGNSRSADFADRVRNATQGRGADVILNTLNGDTVAESFAALREGGRFVELGKLNVWSKQQANERRPDVAFHAFDLGEEFGKDPQLQPRLLAQLQRLLRDGHVRPVEATVTPLANARDAFQQLAQGRHVGKLVIKLPTQSNDLAGDRTYLMTGATGGIALPIAESLVAGGARHLALLARGAVSTETLARLEQLGATVHTVQADCSDRAAMQNALSRLRDTAPPLAGIVHAAGTLKDGLAANLDWPTAEVALRPKVQGAVLLDELTRNESLEFFVVLSSMAGTLGNAGQAAYAAANSFLDAFCAWRRQRGLPATAIAYGPWHGAGMAARLDEALRARLGSSGIDFLHANTASTVLREHRAHDSNVVAMSIRWRDWLQTFGEHVPPLLHEMQQPDQQAATAPEPLDLAAMPQEQRPDKLREVVVEQIARVLGFADGSHVDHERTFQDQGMDSLMAVDAKDRLEAILSTPLPATLLFDHPDLTRLVPHLLAIACPAEESDDGLDAMATDEIARLLAEELREAEGDA